MRYAIYLFPGDANQRRLLRAMSANPPPLGPYSQVKVSGEFAYCSGQLPIDPATNEIVDGGIESQTAAALGNLGRVLATVGLSMDELVKTTIFLRNIDDFNAMNTTYATVLGEVRPARSTIGGVDLPRGALIEIDAIATSRREV
jgi:2-iminobutanoate/2-iminopropanoate deaminase